MSWGVRACRDTSDLIVLQEISELGAKIRVEPIRPRHSSLEVVDDQDFWHSSKMLEGIFQASDQGGGRLAVNTLRVGLP